MSNSPIDINGIKEQLTILLKIKGITPTQSLTEDDYVNLINFKLDYLLSEINCTLDPVEHEDIFLDYNGEDKILLDYYPVTNINSIKIDGTQINSDEYILKPSNGVIKFESNRSSGVLNVKYITQVSETIITSRLTPLLLDWLIYDLDPESSDGLSSIKEGDVSINYDTNNSTLVNLQSRLKDLKNQFNPIRAVMI